MPDRTQKLNAPTRRIGGPIWLLLPIISFLVFYLLQINRQAGQSYAYRALELKRAQLQEQIHDLSWELASARSLAFIQTRSRELGLVTPASVSFAAPGASAVALVK